jgi:hypothetical protein
MRIVTGLLFGLGVVWLAFPYLQQAFAEMEYNMEAKFERSGLSL